MKSNEYFETRYIFTLNISDAKPQDEKNGIYLINYYCNRNKIMPNAPSDFILLAMCDIPCPVCHDHRAFHYIVLVDVVKYLKNNLQNLKFKEALESAQNDSEWIVIPADYCKELNGDRSNIPVSDLWTVEYFKMKGENQRDSNEDEIKGMFYDNY